MAPEEVRTRRGSEGLARGGDERCRANEISGKRERSAEGKENMEERQTKQAKDFSRA